MLFIEIGQRGSAELARKYIGNRFQKGVVLGFLLGFIEKGRVMEESPTGGTPESSVHPY
jgi:hypothetical protein